jgi:hypothetical protein
MPPPLDLTGRRFGRLRVLGLDEERSKREKRRYWLVQCDCEHRTRKVISSRALKSGASQSCGCLAQRFSSTAAKREHASVAKQRVDDREWWSPRIVQRYLHISWTTLDIWWISCPWITGEGIETRELPSGYGRMITYSAKDDVVRVREARDKQSPIPAFPNLVYLKDALAELMCSRSTLRRRMQAARVKVVKRYGKGTDGRPMPRAYVPRRFVEKCKAESPRTNPAMSARLPDEITAGEAATILGATRSAVSMLIYRGILKRSLKTIVSSSGYSYRGSVLSRAQVEAYKADHEPECISAVHQKPDDAATTTPEASPRCEPATLGETEPRRNGRKRGRKRGWRDAEAKKRKGHMIADWRGGKYGSVAALARAYKVDRTLASKVLKRFKKGRKRPVQKAAI